MTHRFPIKEIAAQAGLSTATIDRALNARAHVSAQTQARVEAAITELVAQEQQLSARGRRLFFDVVVEAPERFAREVRRATEVILPNFAPLNLRARFAGQETMTDQEVLAVLRRIAKRGSHGVCLKVRDTVGIRQGVADLHARGIPVVTLVTDVPGSDRIAYAGLDNVQAGLTAAVIVKREIKRGTVLATISNHAFEGEDARWAAFSSGLGDEFEVLLAREGAGLNADTGRAVDDLLDGSANIDAVYSMSGGNRAITAALDRFGPKPLVYIAHDLDTDNIALLQAGTISHVLYHDLEQDMTQAMRHLCGFHKALPTPKDVGRSDVQIIMQTNIPRRFRY